MITGSDYKHLLEIVY